MAGNKALLREADAGAVARLLEREFASELDQLERTVLRAAAGDPAGATDYIQAWLHLADVVTARAAMPARPAGLRHAKVVRRRGGVVPRDRALAAALAAPLSAWTERAGLRLGLALALIALVRETLPGARPLPVPDGTQPAWSSDDARRRAMAHILDAIRQVVDDQSSSVREPTRVYVTAGTRTDVAALRRVAEVFHLDRQGLAGVFGVRRQAVDQWFQRGVPAERQAKLAALLAIVELLARKLKPGAVPGVARTPAKAYGGRTMLKMLADDDHDTLLADVRASFDWASSA